MSKERLNAVLENDYEVKIGYYFSEGFQLYKKNIGGFTGMTLLLALMYAASTAIAMIPILGLIVSLAFSACIYLIMSGYLMVIKKVRNNEPHEFKDFFSGFKGDNLGPVLALNIMSGLLTGLGFLFCVLPGIYLSVAYVFSIYILLFFKIDFWESMEYSRKIVSKKWFVFLGYLLLLALLNMLGVVFLIVGVFVTFPWTLCTLYVSFEDIFKPGADSFENKIEAFGSLQRDINTEADEKNL
jgi:hypothetical protein